MSDYVTVKDLAAELGMDRSGLRKYIIKSGFSLITIRGDTGAKNQSLIALALEDAEGVRALRASQGFSKTMRAPIENGDGFFYAIQVVPDLDPLRIKLGWTYNVSDRLSAHQTAAPTAVLLRSWPCRKVWEYAAMHSVTRIGCKHIGNEVYRCENIDDLLDRGDTFFALMS